MLTMCNCADFTRNIIIIITECQKLNLRTDLCLAHRFKVKALPYCHVKSICPNAISQVDVEPKSCLVSRTLVFAKWLMCVTNSKTNVTIDSPDDKQYNLSFPKADWNRKRDHINKYQDMSEYIRTHFHMSHEDSRQTASKDKSVFQLLIKCFSVNSGPLTLPKTNIINSYQISVVQIFVYWG